MLIGFSNGLSQYGWIALMFIVFAAAAIAFYVRSPEGRLQWDRWRLNVWVVGHLMRQLEVARFARTLGALLKGGVPLLDALGTVQGVVGNRLIARAIAQVQVRVREGKGMVAPLTESGLFPPLALHMIAVGQETGRLESMLTNVAEHFDQEVKRATKRLTALLEPALIVGMGLIIGVIVISMLMAIFSINDIG
jgi:general secretion pathway protein F